MWHDFVCLSSRLSIDRLIVQYVVAVVSTTRFPQLFRKFYLRFLRNSAHDAKSIVESVFFSETRIWKRTHHAADKTFAYIALFIYH